jgi:HPt (histidine-containing phosphotransfer) domain-containing protein
MSADVYEKDIKAAKNSGMDSFIEKPLDKDEVKQSFLNLIDGEIKAQSIKHIKEIDRIVKVGKCNPLKLKKKAYYHLEKNFDTDVVLSLLKTAIQSIEKYINNIQSNIMEEDIYELAEDFHAIKGVLANLGLKEQADSAGAIQKICQEGDFQKASTMKRDFIMNMDCFLNELKRDI